MSKKINLKFVLKALLVLYIMLCVIWSVWYNIDTENAWEIATRRNGLLVFGFDSDGLFVLSPFCNYGDVFIFGIDYDDWRFYSDGFESFGEWFQGACLMTKQKYD